MISCIPAVLARLKADLAVQSFVGTRVWATEAPQSATPPDVILYPVSGLGTPSLAGTLPPYFERIAAECRSPKRAQADLIANAVDLALKDASFEGHGVTIDGCLFVGWTYLYEDLTKLHRKVVDYRVSYRPG